MDFAASVLIETNLCMRIRAAQHHHVQHPRQVDVIDVTSFAGNQQWIFYPTNRSADQTIVVVFSCHEFYLVGRNNVIVYNDSVFV